MATLANIAPGSYLVIAKTTLADIGNQNADTVTCTLDAGNGVTNSAQSEIGKQKDGALHATVSMQLVKTFASSGSTVLSCNYAGNSTVVARYTSIIAVQVTAASQPPSPAREGHSAVEHVAGAAEAEADHHAEDQ